MPIQIADDFVGVPALVQFSTPIRYHDLDPFRFRIVERGGCHYFEEVRLNSPLVAEEDARAVVEFFEGRSLQEVRPERMSVFLGHLRLYPQLDRLVDELRQVLCDE